MKRCDAGWLMAEFAVAFVAGAVGAMVTVHRRNEPVAREHDSLDGPERLPGDAPGRAARRDLQPAS